MESPMEIEISEENHVAKVPDTAYYIPNFITAEEETYLMNQVYAAPKPKWTQLAHRRLQNWGGLPHPKGMLAEKLPPWLDVYARKIAQLGVFGSHVPNHVLVNEYQPRQGIMPHEDGPLFHPVISTINLGTHTMINFYKKNKNSTTSAESASSQMNPEREADISLLLEPRSLLLVKDTLYTDYLHGIEERTEDIVTEKIVNLKNTDKTVGEILTRSTRVSLTIRYVPKILKIQLRLGKR